MTKKTISTIIATILAVTMAFSLSSCAYDYVQTAKNYTPFQGEEFAFAKTADCGTVTEKYVDSPEWKTRSGSGTEYVDLTGKLKGSGEEFVLTFSLTPIEGEKDMFFIEPSSLKFEGETRDAEQAAILLYYMYAAYSGGFGSVQEYLDSPDID